MDFETLRREAVYVEPGIHVSLAPNHGVELTVPISVRGRNWPAGPVLTINFVSLF